MTDDIHDVTFIIKDYDEFSRPVLFHSVILEILVLAFIIFRLT